MCSCQSGITGGIFEPTFCTECSKGVMLQESEDRDLELERYFESAAESDHYDKQLEEMGVRA